MIPSINEIVERLRWWGKTDRIGPDIPWTHILLHFPRAGRKLCANKFAFFGKGAEFRPGAYAIACSKIHIGANVVIRPGTMLFADFEQSEGMITIEDDVLMGAGVHIYVTNHEFRDIAKPIAHQGDQNAKGVLIKKGGWIGANVIILPGVTIGRNSVVGAGSVVVKDIPDFSVAAGNPAVVVKKVSIDSTIAAEA